VIDIPVMVTLLDDHRVVIPTVATIPNHFSFADHIPVTMAFTDGHANTNPANTHADFFCEGGHGGSNHRCGRSYHSKT
jgi:hypothetical protein